MVRTNIPIIPITLYPVYMAINVNIGCIPIWLLTTFGSNNCLTIVMIINKTTNAIDKFIFPLKADTTAQGNITVPEPTIGSASANAINKAISNGYPTFSPNILNENNPN